MTEATAVIREFFDRYAARTNAALADPHALDVEESAAAFAEWFVAAGPAGVMGGRNDEALRASIPEGIAFYRKIGTQSMTIADLRVVHIDELHALAHVDWTAHYRKPAGDELDIAFTVTYLVQTIDGTPRIFAWITGDEQAAYREHGLI